jgi:hypothetical protein
MSQPRKVLPGVGLLSPEELRVAKKSFGYRWREENRNHNTEDEIFGGDVNIREARNWWLIAFAHAMEYARMQRAKEILG